MKEVTVAVLVVDVLGSFKPATPLWTRLVTCCLHRIAFFGLGQSSYRWAMGKYWHSPLALEWKATPTLRRMEEGDAAAALTSLIGAYHLGPLLVPLFCPLDYPSGAV